MLLYFSENSLALHANCLLRRLPKQCGHYSVQSYSVFAVLYEQQYNNFLEISKNLYSFNCTPNIFSRSVCFIMPPALKKLEGILLLGRHLSICLSIRPSVHSSICPFVTLFDALHNFRTMHDTVLKFLIYGFLMKK